MRTTLTLVLCTLLCSAHAQKNNLTKTLQTYKYRTSGVAAQSISGTVGGALNNNSNINGNTQRQLSFSPQYAQSYFISTNKKIRQYDFGVSPNGNFSKTKYTSGPVINNRFVTYASNSMTNYTYKKPDRFFKTIITQNFFVSNERYKNANQPVYKERGEQIYNGISFGIGKGRLENVTDVQMAWYILEDLQKNKYIKDSLSADLITGLAKIITQVNNRRVFDFRRRHIYELTQIDSFLQNNGGISTGNIGYYTVISDNWLYAFNQNRSHGFEKYILLTPALAGSRYQNKNKLPGYDSIYSIKNDDLGLQLQMGVTKNTAKTMRKQFNRGASLSTGYWTNRQIEKRTGVANQKFTSHEMITQLNAYVFWGYYPNSRTATTLSFSDFVYWWHSGNQVENALLTGFQTSYFISYNTRLTAQCYALLQSPIANSGTSRHTGTASFNIGINHFFR